MLLLMFDDAKVSHNEVYALSEPCSPFQLALHTVFYSVFPVTLMCAGFPFMSMPALCT